MLPPNLIIMNDYAFHSRPAPLKLQPPTQPPRRQLPPPPVKPSRRASFCARITNWAGQIQPGTPALPSPQGLTGGIAHNRVPTSPLINPNPISIPTSDDAFDLTAHGYNRDVFVQLSKTPVTPSSMLRAREQKQLQLFNERQREKAAAKEESKEKRGQIIKKFKSLANISRAASKAISKPALMFPGALVSPIHTTTTARIPNKSQNKADKKATYGILARSPLPLANELALMQFADGGKLESHICRLAATETGTSDVYRDAKGGIWIDREEELEYHALLEPLGDDEDHCTSPSPNKEEWVKFEPSGQASPIGVLKPQTTTIGRRGSTLSAASSADSDLDPTYLIQAKDAPFYPDERVLSLSPAVTKSKTSKTPLEAALEQKWMLLSLPARPFRAAKHLRKPEFMVDMQAFGLAMSNCAAAAANTVASAAGAIPGANRSRKRPAPLKISPGMSKMKKIIAVSSPGSGVPPLSAARPFIILEESRSRELVVNEGKKDFLGNSFKPEPTSCFESDDEEWDGDSEYDCVAQATLEKSKITAPKSQLSAKAGGMFRRG